MRRFGGVRRFIVCLALALVCLWLQIQRLLSVRVKSSLRFFSSAPISYTSWGPFESIEIPGFVNTGRPGTKCDQLKHKGTVGLQNSTYLDDDLVQVAESLHSHPMIIYPEHLQDPALSRHDVVNKTWARLSGSSAYLPDHGVFLCVARVIFYTGSQRDEPIISFVRGQLFDQDWVHLDNHTITWKNETLTFPLVFDIPAEFEEGGGFYGPEDPRIIIEEGAQDAEPVIIFNMISETSDWLRAMWIFRPFSGHSTVLTIRGTERAWAEKNWAPFFLSSHEPKSTAIPNLPREPSRYLHFVYSFKPLRILKCHLVTGDCTYVFEQTIPDSLATPHADIPGILRGGTNFISVPLPVQRQPVLRSVSQPVRAFVAFPRTNIAGSCSEPFYRPELVIMVTAGTHFHLAFTSDSLEFGAAVMDPVSAAADPCGAGRVLIANSIPLWDTDHGQDIMTLTFSVDDSTVQVARLQGMLGFVQNLPGLKAFSEWYDQMPVNAGSDVMQNTLAMQYSVAGDDVRACGVEAAWNYTVEYTKVYVRTEKARQEDEETTRRKEEQYWRKGEEVE